MTDDIKLSNEPKSFHNIIDIMKYKSLSGYVKFPNSLGITHNIDINTFRIEKRLIGKRICMRFNCGVDVLVYGDDELDIRVYDKEKETEIIITQYAHLTEMAEEYIYLKELELHLFVNK